MDTSVFFKNGKFVKQSVRAKKYDSWFESLSLRFDTTNRSELLWLLNNGAIKSGCRECGQPTKYLNYENGYRQLCSNKCAQVNVDTKERRVDAIKGFFKNHHQVNNSMQLEKTKSNLAKTNIERYGVPWYVQTESFKTESEKTSIKNWGTKNPQQSDAIKEQTKLNIQLKYGRTTARSFEQNRLARIDTVKKWCLDLAISHDEILPDISLSEHKITFFHSCGKTWEQQIGTTLPACPICHKGSKVEQHVKAWVEEIGISAVFNDRTSIKPLELDIFFPDHKLAIEVNGLYWHHDGAGRTSVKEKTDICEVKGIQLISIWEHEWHDELCREKIKSIILAKLGKSTRIFARKTILKEINLNEARLFLNENHLQNWTSASETVGLYYQNELVMLMSVGVRRWATGSDKEIIRLCSKKGITVVGGFSKLLLHFKGQRLLSYCDRRFGTGAGYSAVGFKQDGITKPNYLWWKGNTFLKRGSTTKQRLPALLKEMFNQDLSENKNMENAGWRKLSDAGNLRFFINL